MRFDYETRETVFHQDIQTPRRELKIRRAAEYLWRNSRCLDSWWNTVSSIWIDIFLNRNKSPGGYLTKFNTGRLRPEVQPLTLLYTILAEKVPLLYTFYWEKVPLSHTYFRNCTSFLSPHNEVNEQYYGKISSIIRRNAKQTTSVIYSLHAVKRPISLPFYIPQLVKSLPFYIPEAWKRYPFRAEPPRIGQYREYPPPPGNKS